MSMLPSELYKVEQIRALEQAAFKAGLTEQVLMARAGSAAYDVFGEEFPDVTTVAIFCGNGNNGGDGYVLAQLLHEDDIDVIVYRLGEISDLPPVAKEVAQLCQKSGVIIKPFSNDIELDDVELIVDAILGIGLKGEVRGQAQVAIALINESDANVLAIDTPSGLDVDTGAELGQAVVADATVTYIGLKQGMLTGRGIACCGEIFVNDLDLDDALYEEIPINAWQIDAEDMQAFLPKRARDAHKGDFGHVLVIGGDYGMPGATRMAGEAALRVGAGLVTVATRPEHIDIISANRPELMCYGIDDEKALAPLLERATVIALGPGLGESTWSQAIFNYILQTSHPLIVDASALNLLAKQKSQRGNWVLTPHPGEAATLLSCTAADIQQDRFSACIQLKEMYQADIILKGAGTITLADNDLPYICHGGNPGMATAGMGDILTGMLAGFMAQQFPAELAVKLAVCLHAQAGDLQAAIGERGMLATDLFQHFPELLNPQDDMDDYLETLRLLEENYEV